MSRAHCFPLRLPPTSVPIRINTVQEPVISLSRLLTFKEKVMHNPTFCSGWKEPKVLSGLPRAVMYNLGGGVDHLNSEASDSKRIVCVWRCQHSDSSSLPGSWGQKKRTLASP